MKQNDGHDTSHGIELTSLSPHNTADAVDNTDSVPLPSNDNREGRGGQLFPYNDDLLQLYTDPPAKKSLGRRFVNYLQRNYVPKSIPSLLFNIFPFLAIGQRGYRLNDAKNDLISGLTLAVVLIPQSLAYAPLAGLPPQYGLYNAFLMPILYMMFGTTRELSIGPFALVSLVIFESVSKMYPDLVPGVEADLPMILSCVVTLTFCVGLWLLLMTILKLGWIMDLFSSPAVAGLIMASTLTISMSQMGTLFQISVGQGSFIEMVIEMFKNIHKTNAATFIIGITCTIILCTVDYFNKRLKLTTPIPGQILLVIIVTAISYGVGFHDKWNVAVIGEISMGIPAPTTPEFSQIFKTTLSSGHSNSIPPYLMNSLPIALICFIISAAVSNEMSNKNHYPVNYNNELFALSACSLIGSFVNCYSSSASLSRTAVVDSTKPSTILWNVVSSVILAFVLFVVASLLHHTPKAILAAVVISSFRSAYMKITLPYEIYKQSRGEAFVYIVTFLACLCISTPVGLIAAFISSLWFVVYSTAMSPSLTLRQVGLTPRYVNYELLKPYTVQEYYEMLDHCRIIDDGTGDGSGTGGMGCGAEDCDVYPNANIRIDIQPQDDFQQRDESGSTKSQGQSPQPRSLLPSIALHQRSSSDPVEKENQQQSHHQQSRSQTAQSQPQATSPHVCLLDHHFQSQRQLPPHFYDHRITIMHVRQPLTFLNHNLLSSQVRRLVKQVRNRHYNPAPTDFDDQLEVPAGSEDGFVHPVDPTEGLAPDGKPERSVSRMRRPSVSVHATHRSGGMLPPRPEDSAGASMTQPTTSRRTSVSRSTSRFRSRSRSTLQPPTEQPSIAHEPGTAPVIHMASDMQQPVDSPTMTLGILTHNGTPDPDLDAEQAMGSDDQDVPQDDEPLDDGEDGQMVSLLTRPLHERVLITNQKNFDLLSTYEQTLLSTMVRALISQPQLDRIRQYKHVIILDSIVAVDTTAHGTLHKLMTAYKEFLFLFTNPSLTFFTQFMTKKLSNRPTADLPHLSAPSNYAFPSLHVAVLFSIAFLDTVTSLPQDDEAESASDASLNQDEQLLSAINVHDNEDSTRTTAVSSPSSASDGSSNSFSQGALAPKQTSEIHHHTNDHGRLSDDLSTSKAIATTPSQKTSRTGGNHAHQVGSISPRSTLLDDNIDDESNIYPEFSRSSVLTATHDDDDIAN